MLHKPRIRLVVLCKAWMVALLVFLSTPYQVQSAETVSFNFDTYQVWGYFEQGWQAYGRDDWVEAYRLLALAWPLYNQLRGNPASPFPQDSQFYDDFKATLERVRGELVFWVQQFPAISQQEGENLARKLSECRFQLTGRDARYGFQLPMPARPPKPHLDRVPPPRR